MAVAPCDKCGFDPAALEPGRLPERIPALAAELASRITGTDPAALRVAGAALAWSALDYAGHVCDVLELFDRRVVRIRAVDGADLEVVDHDALVAEQRYRERDPTELAGRLRVAAGRLAATLAATPAEDWVRSGRRAGEQRTISDVAYRAVHEEIHHLHDIDRLVGYSR